MPSTAWSYSSILAHYYTGTALGAAPAGAKVRVLIGSTVKTLPLETYVRGVISAEMPASWPAAALEAQAVAVRTYALTAHAGGSQVRRLLRHALAGLPRPVRRNREHERRDDRHRRADRHLRRRTRDHLLLRLQRRAHRRRPGRLSRRRREPWLVGVSDPYDQGPGTLDARA